MKQVIQNLRTGKTEVIDVPIPQIREGYALVKTTASLVSAGTERNLVEFAEKSLIGKARSRPDLMKQILEKASREGILTTLDAAFNRLDQPLALGYSSAGKVIEVGKGVVNFKPGDRVVCAGGGYAVHAEFQLIPRNLISLLPESVDDESGAFTTVGAISLNGIRLAAPQVGESVAIIGLGLLGLITAQIVQASGCEAAGFDINPARVKFARRLGINSTLNKNAVGQYKSMTRGRGFDHVLICADTPADDTVELAGTITRDRGHVVSIGVVGLDLPRKIYFEKELQFQVSRSSGPGRYDNEYEQKGKDYPVGYVRWTEGRNLEAFVDLLEKSKVNVRKLITHRFPIENAQKAYEIITGKINEEYLGILLTYPDSQKSPLPLIELRSGNHSSIGQQKISIGVLGAGNYAGAVFLPAIQKTGDAELRGIASSGGISACNLGKKFGFEFATSSDDEIIHHPRINTLVVLTRHDSHARLTLAGLRNGKNIYCEKPLALEKKELKLIEKELLKQNHPYLTVGFNRRFAPFTQSLKSFMENRVEPLYCHYRINAGYLPPSHWLNDSQSGGGRLVGECCHFFDAICFLTGEKLKKINAIGMPDKGKYTSDNLQITLEFQDGSIGSIAYLANGNRNISKEYIEVFCEGKIGILDDFRELTLVEEGKRSTSHSRFRQDKGHTAAWQAFAFAITNGLDEPIPYEDLLQSSYAVLAARYSLQTGQPVILSDYIKS